MIHFNPQSKCNVNFKSRIKPTEFLRAGFEKATDCNTSLEDAEKFYRSIEGIRNDMKYDIIEFTTPLSYSREAKPVTVFINDKKEISDKRYPGTYGEGSQCIEAVSDIAQKRNTIIRKSTLGEEIDELKQDDYFSQRYNYSLSVLKYTYRQEINKELESIKRQIFS